MGKNLLLIGAMTLAMVWMIPSGGTFERASGEQRMQASTSSGSADEGDDEVVLRRDDDSHFYAKAEVNGAKVRFLVDSGASSVVLTKRDAKKADIDVDREDFHATARTASGLTAYAPVTIDEIEIGGVKVRQVTGAVADDGLDVSLLGQSFLERLDKVEIEGDEMTLR